MDGRAPGIQCMNALSVLKRGHWDGVPYNPSGGGCGAAMRTMCIGKQKE
jgi:ADP-ribosylarginine hydrolase